MKLRTLIIVIIAVLVVIGVGLYFLLGRGSANPAAPSGQTGALPNTGNQQFPAGQNQTGQTGMGAGSGNGANGSAGTASSTHFGVVSSEPVLDYFVDAQNHALVVEPDGQIKSIIGGQGSVAATVTILSSSIFTNIVRAAFSSDGKKVLVSFISSNTGSNTLQTSVFDIATKTWLKLPAGMQSPVWSPAAAAPASYQIAYLQSTGASTETIYTINPATAASAGAKPTAMGTITAQDMTLQWPNKTTMVVSDKPSVYAAGSAWFFNIASGTLTPAAYENPGLETAWSNTTSTLGLIFAGGAQNSGGQLALVDAKGNQKAISFTTLPSKCGFSLITATSSLSIFCAVPRDQQTFSIARLPDEYEQKILFTADDFYKINTTDGTLSTIFNDPSQTLDATKLKVFNNTLFFVNRYDSKLYAISLQ